MGRYSAPLSPQLADLAGVRAGQRVVDVGCGPGALTAELVAPAGRRRGRGRRPVRAVRRGRPRAKSRTSTVQQAAAEQLPFPDASFDAALAQLVVHFMSDPDAGVGEMRRVTKQGGVIAACVWDHGGGRGPVNPLWEAALALDPTVTDESALYGSNEGQLQALFERVGLRDVEETAIASSVEHPTFEEWWEPFTFGVGPAGTYIAALDDEHRAALREQCRATLPDAPFTVTAYAWTARGVV